MDYYMGNLENQRRKCMKLYEKLLSIQRNEENSYDFNIKSMTILQLNNRVEELNENLKRRYSKSQHEEYKQICKIINKKININEWKLEQQLNRKTHKFLSMFLTIVENEKGLYLNLQEIYLYMYINILSELISCLKKEAVKNQDLVDFIINNIKEKVLKFNYIF